MNTKKLKELIRTKYAWPGGYEIVFLTSDGAILCNDCVRGNFQSIIWSIKNNVSDGWKIVEYSYEAVSAENTRELAGEDYVSYCDHCGKEFRELGR